MTLTKRDLVTRISEETGLGAQQVLDVVQRTLGYIAETLAKRDQVNFETFVFLKSRCARHASAGNPNAPGGRLAIPERLVLRLSRERDAAEF